MMGFAFKMTDCASQTTDFFRTKQTSSAFSGRGELVCAARSRIRRKPSSSRCFCFSLNAMDSAYSLPGPAFLMKNSFSFFTAKINVFYNAAPCRARRHARRRGLRHLLPYRELLLVLPPGRPKIIIFQRAKSIHLSIEEWLHLNVQTHSAVSFFCCLTSSATRLRPKGDWIFPLLRRVRICRGEGSCSCFD